MAKLALNYICQSCGAAYPKWQGKCDSCGEWSTISEEKPVAQFSKISARKKSSSIEIESLEGRTAPLIRIPTKIVELDRVLGGGMVPGSAVLVGGDPGIGKSTILLQALSKIPSNSIYITGEESIDQVRLRASRLGLKSDHIKLAAATSVGDIILSLKAENASVIVIDSIQTMFVDAIESAPGTVGQIRTSAYELINHAKASGSVVLLVGHVTKDGQIAGPKVLEHMVDTVLYFEGERGHQFRILRAVKNRFGSANEIGVFEMTEQGLKEVPNPSSLFLSGRGHNISGSAVFAGIEGTRPILVEIQALVTKSYMSYPRRAVVGWDNNRLSMILAILEARLNISMNDKEVYLNIAGGLRLTEPAADLAVAASIISALTNVPLPDQSIFFGEVGLSSEIRPVSYSDIRLKEAEKLGFKMAYTPRQTNMSKKLEIKVKELKFLNELKEYVF